MQFIRSGIPDVIIIEPLVREDSRGYFMESFLAGKFNKEVFPVSFVQENESMSKRGVVRGLHYQADPWSQSKLIRVVTGRIIDIAVDLRRGSPTFKKYVSVDLSEQNKRQLFIPRGFAHGFSVLEDNTIVQYKTDNPYKPDSERAVRWNDPQLNIDWQLPLREITLSEKDKNHPLLSEAELFDYHNNLNN
ncbi:MAG: dTDP-4-dehydrorhamnose 3,5-epimerase [Bacteroidales bacterium]|nr:dTDP-4-dehydrorhamnose 3,5-epimerase [Bacteroidales bacterium]MDD3990041.1 dTDP-4-dehydrorhamnose 3,5-epimerase [Bacteroidales bacterium]